MFQLDVSGSFGGSERYMHLFHLLQSFLRAEWFLAGVKIEKGTLCGVVAELPFS